MPKQKDTITINMKINSIENALIQFTYKLMAFLLLLPFVSEVCNLCYLQEKNGLAVYGCTMEWSSLSLNTTQAVFLAGTPLAATDLPEVRMGMEWPSLNDLLGISLQGKSIHANSPNEKGRSISCSRVWKMEECNWQKTSNRFHSITAPSKRGGYNQCLLKIMR